MAPSTQEYSVELAQLLKALSSTLARDARRLDSTSQQLLDASRTTSRTAARSTIRGLQGCLGPLMHCAIGLRKQHARIQRLVPTATHRQRRS